MFITFTRLVLIKAFNFSKIWGGLFVVDMHKILRDKALEIISRFTWELPQTVLGMLVAQTANILLKDVKVSYYVGTTLTQTNGKWGAVALGSFITGSSANGRSLQTGEETSLFQHEYGHYLQSHSWGPVYLISVGIPSLYAKATTSTQQEYMSRYPEQDANRRSLNHWKRKNPDFKGWDYKRNVITE